MKNNQENPSKKQQTKIITNSKNEKENKEKNVEKLEGYMYIFREGLFYNYWSKIFVRLIYSNNTLEICDSPTGK